MEQKEIQREGSIVEAMLKNEDSPETGNNTTDSEKGMAKNNNGLNR